jgi:hypothetical protein
VLFLSVVIGEAMRLEGPTIVKLGGIPMIVLFTAGALVFSVEATAGALVFSVEAGFIPAGCSGDGDDSDVEGWLVDGLTCASAVLIQ